MNGFNRPGRFDLLFGRLMMVLVRGGLVRGAFHVLEVPGRRSGRLFSVPVDVLDRGDGNWVRNARAAGAVTLIQGRRRQAYAVRELPAADRAPILKAYLDRFATEVQRFFPVPKGMPAEAFAELAPRYPVFELRPVAEAREG